VFDVEKDEKLQCLEPELKTQESVFSFSKASEDFIIQTHPVRLGSNVYRVATVRPPCGCSSENRLNDLFPLSTTNFDFSLFMKNQLFILILVEELIHVCYSLFAKLLTRIDYGRCHGIEGSNRSLMKLSVMFFAKFHVRHFLFRLFFLSFFQNQLQSA
jgi:hypothetical protein